MSEYSTVDKKLMGCVADVGQSSSLSTLPVHSSDSDGSSLSSPLKSCIASASKKVFILFALVESDLRIYPPMCRTAFSFSYVICVTGAGSSNKKSFKYLHSDMLVKKGAHWAYCVNAKIASIFVGMMHLLLFCERGTTSFPCQSLTGKGFVLILVSRTWFSLLLSQVSNFSSASLG